MIARMAPTTVMNRWSKQYPLFSAANMSGHCYIASLKHTHRDHEHISFWGKDHRGYTMVFGDYMGQYDEAEAIKHNDGESYIAVPCDSVKHLLSPEPYCKPDRRFYDQRGPVIENTRGNWGWLIAASIKLGRTKEPNPEVFRGKRRAIYTQEVEQVSPVAEAPRG